MNIRDRHGDNYLVTPKGIHSIDHEYGFGDPDKDSVPSALYKQMLKQGIEPIASEEHLNRWERFADEYRKMIQGNPEHLVPQHEHRRAREIANRHLELFNKRLQMARQLADHYGHVPIKHLLSARHRAVLHGEL
jgi:hypothetical protein